MVKKVSCKVIGSCSFTDRRGEFRDVSQSRKRHSSSSLTYTRQLNVTEVSLAGLGGCRLDDHM